jgi:CRISPR-associated protein Csd1
MLQALMNYGEGLDSEPGFKTREVRWCVDLGADGRFLNVLPLGDGKRGAPYPRCPDMHNMNAGGKAHFLVETAQTSALLFKASEEQNKIEGTHGKHQFFIDMLRSASKASSHLAVIADVLEDESSLAEIRKALSENRAKPTDWLGWRVDGNDPREDQRVQTWWREWRKMDMANEHQDLGGGVDNTMLCLLTGQPVKPLLTHPPITGLSGVGGSGMGDKMASFDKAAFSSFGLDQSNNAAMSDEAAQKYVDGLNDLIRHQSRKLANALVVHWFKERVAPQDDPLEWLNGFESQEQTEAAAQGAARRLLESIRKGERADLGNNTYYALSLSG